MTRLDLGREVRTARFELRSASDSGTASFEGYASVFEHPYPVYGGPELGGWTETVARGAFTKTLTDTTNRALLYGHDNAQVVLTSRSGLQLAEDEVGLRVAGELDLKVSWIADLVRQVDTGVVDEMSIGFYVLRAEWSPDYMDRRITEIKLIEASIVWAGANDATVAGVAARARDAVATARHAAAPAITARHRAAALAASLRTR